MTIGLISVIICPRCGGNYSTRGIKAHMAGIRCMQTAIVHRAIMAGLRRAEAGERPGPGEKCYRLYTGYAPSGPGGRSRLTTQKWIGVAVEEV